VITLRDIYIRHFRGSAFGNAARRLWYFCKAWRASSQHGMSSIGVLRTGAMLPKHGTTIPFAPD